MKRIANFCVFVSFLMGYLEWGSNQHRFIAFAEWEILSKAGQNIGEVLHPFIILPFIGQLLILITFFQKNPNRLMSLMGVGCLASIMVFLSFIGIISLNIRIFAASLPFFIKRHLGNKIELEKNGIQELISTVKLIEALCNCSK